MASLSVLINHLQQIESSSAAGHLPVCLADWMGTYQPPNELELPSVSVSFEAYKDENGNDQMGQIVKFG